MYLLQLMVVVCAVHNIVAELTMLQKGESNTESWRSPATLWLRGNPGQKCSDLWSAALNTPADNFAPTLIDKLLHGASSLCGPNSFGAVAVDCGAHVGNEGSDIFSPPDAADSAALTSIVNTFSSEGWNVNFVLSLKSKNDAQHLVNNTIDFAQKINSFLKSRHLSALQLDLRLLSYDAKLNPALTEFILDLAVKLDDIPLSVVINAAAEDGSDIPLNLATIGSETSPKVPVTIVTTGTFTSNVADIERIINTTSDALGGVSISSILYAPGLSISDEYDEFKPKMYQLWGKIAVLQARQVSKLYVDLNFLKPDTDGQRTDAYLPLIGTMFQAPRDQSENLPELDNMSDAAMWTATQQTWRKEALVTYDLQNVSEAPAYTTDNTAHVSFSAPQVMLHDRFLFDRASGKWTVQNFLNDVKKRYGGVDTVLLWHNYPNIGVDDQSQFDLFDSLPGGVEVMKTVVEDFHKAGVKVLLSYNPWDTGTKAPAKEVPDYARVVQLIKAVGADGVNGDTMNGMPEEWWIEAERLNYPVMLQPELGFGSGNWLHNITFNTMSWAYLPYDGPLDDNQGWLGIAKLPIVSKYSYLVPSHHAQICERWARQHVNGLQHAFFSGRGFVPWENVWGVFNAVNEGDGEALRRIRPLLTFVATLNLTIGGNWTPFTLDVQSVSANVDDAIAASSFSAFERNKDGRDDYLWLMVNRRSRDDEITSAADEVSIDAVTTPQSACFYDLYHGINITNRVTANELGGTKISITIDPMDYGAVLRTGCDEKMGMAPGLRAFLSAQKLLIGGRKLSSFNFTALAQPQQIRSKSEFSSRQESNNRNTSSITSTGSFDDMIAVPEYGSYEFQVSGVQVEGWHGFPGVSASMQPDVQFEWESTAQRVHQAHNISSSAGPGGFHIDRNLVTNAEYFQFIEESKWWPSNDSAADGESLQNFLNHWTSYSGDASFPPKKPVVGTEKQPVRWVSMNDARRYCAHFDKRLPRDFEWQFAAQGGNESLVYPWGNQWDASRVPPVVTTKNMGDPVDVGSFPNGSSPFGVQDLVGHLWQWTDEFCDVHTCRGIVRGGHWWRPMGSMWYFPQAYELTQHNTILLLSDSMDRNGGTGFRCVADN